MFPSTCFFLVIFCVPVSVAAIKIPLNIDNIIKKKQETILKCAIELANKEFDYRLHTAIYCNDVESSVINNFIASYQGSVIIETKRDAAPPTQVIVIVDTFHSFVKILTKLKPDIRGKSLLSGGAKFLILLLSNSKRLERIMSILWSYYVTNVVIVTGNKKNLPSLYTYFPYLNHRNCRNVQPSVIGYCKENMTIKNVFSDKMSNMKGCPLYISTDKLYYPSIEQKIPLQITKKILMRLLRDKMNFTPIISSKDYISMDSARAQNWSDSLNDVISGRANISTCSIPLGFDRSGLLDFSAPYFRICFAWMTTPIKAGPVLWRLLSPLNGYLWLALLIVVISVTSLPLLFKIEAVKRNGRRFFKKIDKLHGVLLRIWGILMGQPVRMAPTRFRDFYIISLWLWFTYVIRNAYQSVLIVSLKTDTIVGTFNDLNEAIEDGYRLGGRASFLAYFEHDPVIKEKFVTITDVEFDYLFSDVVEGRKKFVVATSLEYAIAYCLSRGIKEDQCGQILLDPIMTVPLVIWMKHSSPFMRPISTWLPRFDESGLLSRESTVTQTGTTLKSSDPTPLTSKQFTSCILCLILGFICSFVVFVIEICVFKIKEYRQNKIIQFTM